MIHWELPIVHKPGGNVVLTSRLEERALVTWAVLAFDVELTGPESWTPPWHKCTLIGDLDTAGYRSIYRSPLNVISNPGWEFALTITGSSHRGLPPVLVRLGVEFERLSGELTL